MDPPKVDARALVILLIRRGNDPDKLSNCWLPLRESRIVFPHSPLELQQVTKSPPAPAALL